ncbi:MAG: flagellar biosynthesis protein FlgB [Actinomycetota bacterium]
MIVGSNETEFLAAALRGLEAQRKAAEHNVANVETPGFKARRVSFEQALAEAMTAGDPSQTAISTWHSSAPGRIDGSNVDLDDEMRALELNALQQQLVNTAINARYTRLRTSIGQG